MVDENLISTLETSLRQTRNAQHRLMSRLNEVEGEANRLRQEIDALNNSAKQTEAAIISLLETMRSGNQSWDLVKNLKVNDDYEIPQEIKRYTRQIPNNQSNQNNQNYQPQNNRNYNNNSVAYMNQQRNTPSISQNVEPISHRFVDRTITQACTLLLKEVGRSLHVNELYNLLCAGGMEFRGNNPTISIAVSLNRNRRFRKVAPGTFDLVMRDASQAAS
jgi:hypothetical protein